MRKKIVRLPKLDRLRITPRKTDMGVGPCAIELSAVLNCWNNNSGPDAAECRAFVDTLTNCMRTYVCFPFSPYTRLCLRQTAETLSSKVKRQFLFVLPW